MGRKQVKNKQSISGSKKDPSSHKRVSKSHNTKSLAKLKKKQTLAQIMEVDRLDLQIGDICMPKPKEEPKSSLQGKQIQEHYKEDRYTVQKQQKLKQETEKKIDDQLKLISGFSL